MAYLKIFFANAPWLRLLTSAICDTHDELTEKLGLTTLFLCIETIRKTREIYMWN